MPRPGAGADLPLALCAMLWAADDAAVGAGPTAIRQSAAA